ncbi:MAG: helix-turn-helix transcriptional regulator [Acidobacteriota bacterium]|nr:helix-turn-helix transcriptional regulator [Acidobacteriota bacterium]
MTRVVQPEGQLFGARLRQMRKRRRLTQEDLGKAAGLAGPFISDMERGLKVPSLTTILRLAVALDCKVTDLIAIFDKTDLLLILPK